MISIIIPVYNVSQYLNRCLNSVLTQSYRDLEILIIDDGSTDDSGDICNHYAAEDNRIKVIHLENCGVSAARNIGLSMAHGEYIAFIDGDDWINQYYFELLHNALENTNCEIAMCHYREVWNEDFSSDISENKEFSIDVITNNRLYEMLLAIPIDTYRSSSIPYDVIWGKLYKKDILKGLFFKKIWMEDVEFNSRLYMRVEKAVIIQLPLYTWIQYPQSLHRKCSYKNLDGLLRSNIQIFQNISPEYDAEKGKALKRVFLSVLSSRYLLSHYSKFEPSRAQVESLIKNTVSELLPVFLKCSNIHTIFKVGITIFYYIPFTYELFRWIVSKYPKLQK